MSFQRKIIQNMSNLPGWRSDRKLIIFESDDWGAVRMSSKKAYSSLYKKGQLQALDQDEVRYLKNDGLADENDLDALFQVLLSYKDYHGHHPIFTALCLSTNPNFEKIKQDNFENYHYELYTETLKRYPNHTKSHDLKLEGQRKNIFSMQFHGREHLNVHHWMNALKQNENETKLAFDWHVYGISPKKPISRVSYQAAFDLEEILEIEQQRIIIEDGVKLFNNLYQTETDFFVPTNGPFHYSLLDTCSKMGIKYFGVSKLHKMPIGQGKTKLKFNFLGQKTKFGQIKLTRNAIFEPSSCLRSDWVGSCMLDISNAFKYKKPAVISTHRANYIGWLNESNRKLGLTKLDELISSILKKWPDAEFISSSDLGRLISNEVS